MEQSFLTEQNIKAAVTLLILAAAIVSFVRERISPDLTALLAVLALLLTGVLTPLEAFAGFSHPATVSVAAVLVLSAAIEKTGMLSSLARRLLLPIGHSELLLTATIMVTIGLLSAFINNTAAVAVFIPVVLEICRKANLSPGRVLMPMSHAATIGGMCTLIGTSTNLVAHEYARSQGLPGFSMFELGKVGIPMVIIGYAYMLFIGRRSLPKNQLDDIASARTESYLSELVLDENSAMVGREIDEEAFERDFDLELISVRRGSRALPATETERQFKTGDSLVVRGALEQILKLTSRRGLTIHKPEGDAEDEKLFAAVGGMSEADEDLHLAEVVVLTPSGLVGRTLRGARFAETYDTYVVALGRRGGEVKRRPTTIPLHAGDILVVEARSEALAALADKKGFLVIGDVTRPPERTGKALITLITLVGVIVSVAIGAVPIVTAAVAACAILILTRSIRLREAYQAIDMSIVFLLAGSLALGAALEKTGVTTMIASGLTTVGGDLHPMLIVSVFLFSAIILSEFLSNSGTVPLLAPIALAVSESTGIAPMALIAAVTFGSTAAFAMPIGYQTSLMIYGVGGYSVKDFVKMGVVLDVLLAAIALMLIPLFWM